jgi:hypothetical protein
VQYHGGEMKSDWIFLSKNGKDEYINMFARGCGSESQADFDYDHGQCPIVLRGILKHKLMKRCWQDQRDFYYMDTGYFGNTRWKTWHRIVKNDLQHTEIRARSADRLSRFNLPFHARRHGSKIVFALPDEKPCRFYDLDRHTWIQQTLQQLKQHTDREIILRERAPKRLDRIVTDPLHMVLQDDVHALITFNSVAAVESILAGVPAFVLAPSHAAAPVANRDLAMIEKPFWPDDDLRHAWAAHLAYGQFHIDELQDGTAYRILNED